MKQTLLTCFLFFTSLFSFGQCPPGDVLLTTQTDVDDFVSNYGSCQVIDGDFEIASIDDGDVIDDLTGLNQLTTIYGNLTISSLGYYNPDNEENIPASIEGLENITSAHSLIISGENHDHPNVLQSLVPLNGMSGELDTLSLEYVILEEHLPNFEELTSIGTLIYHSLVVDGSTPEFPQVDQLGRVLASGQDDLPSTYTTLYIPDNVTEIAGGDEESISVGIENHPFIEEVRGGFNLITLGDFGVYNCQELTDLTAFSNVTTTGSFVLGSCRKEAFDSFHNLTSAKSVLYWINNDFGCEESFPKLTVHIGQNSEVFEMTGGGDVTLFATRMDTLEIKTPFKTIGSFLFQPYELYEVEGFSMVDSVKSMNGSAHPYFHLMPDFLNRLPNFSNLVYVEGDLELSVLGFSSDADHIENLDGLNALEWVGGNLRIVNGGWGQNLTSLDGLESLRHAKNVTVSSFGNLADISVLEDVETIEQRLRLSFLPSLDQDLIFDDLSHLDELEVYATALESFPQFPGLDSLSILEVDFNDFLLYLDGFQTLEYMHYLEVKGNDLLEDINLGYEVDNIDLEWDDNPSLELCGSSPSICHILSSSNTWEISLSDNGSGCNNLNQILEQCAVLSNDVEERLDFTLRILENQIGITSSINSPSVLTMYSVTGKMVMQQNMNLVEGDQLFSIPEMSSGIYFIELLTQRSRKTEKVLIP